ncbi:MAG: hypothetical protein JKY51_06825 [Opitutaceae bacterium]|nr:hypothetical protein [Opitutaceae bacterium]
MTKKEHRLGVHEVNLVIRHLKLDEPATEAVEAAISEIDQLFGMDGVSFDDKSYVINLAYDASHIGIGQIEGILAKYSLDISHDWWTELKEGYYRFVDQNIKDNAKHEPWSCHKTPPGQ